MDHTRSTARHEFSIGASESIAPVPSLNARASSVSEAIRTLRFRQASGTTSKAEQVLLVELEESQREAREVERALRELAAEHAHRGAEMAKRLLRTSPGSYRGYRVAADYHRLRGDWPAFEEALAALAKANPSSNGLVFLRALEAQAEGDPASATKLLRTALERDPRFVRAQARIVLLQTSPDRAYVELTKLKAMNSRHQLVALAGPFIEAASKSGARSTASRDRSVGRPSDRARQSARERDERRSDGHAGGLGRRPARGAREGRQRAIDMFASRSQTNQGGM